MTQAIAGKWIFNLENELRAGNGFAFFMQDENGITGFLEFEERVVGEASFFVHQEISGTMVENTLSLKGTKALSADGSILSNYNLDTMEGTYTFEGKIVGRSVDNMKNIGVFILHREP